MAYRYGGGIRVTAEAGWNGSTKLQKKKQGEENLKVECCGSLAAHQKTWWFNEGKTDFVIQKPG